MPYGMVALGPDTYHGNLWNAGYRYNDTHILSFSHVHNAQTAGVPVMPVVGPCKALHGLAASRSKFSHAGEVAKPGYHKIRLDDDGITAELTASPRAGFHRYTFPAAKEAHIIMDLTAALGPVSMLKGYARQVSGTEIEGYSVMAPTFRRKKNCTVYFFARFSKPAGKINFWQSSPDSSGAKVLTAASQVEDSRAGLYASFYNLREGEQLMLQVGISFVSMANAKLNLESELNDWNFEAAVAKARRAWNDYLGRIEVTGGTRQQQVKFYTDLMHTAIGRRMTEDVNGQYLDNSGPDPVVRNIPLTPEGRPAFHFLDTDALWGTQWNLNVLWSMVYPEFGNNVAATLLAYYRNAGLLARDSWGGNMAYVMVGDQATPLLAALMQTGRAAFDQQEAFAGAHKNAFPGGIRDRAGYEAGPNPQGGGIDWYVRYGYVPYEISKRGSGFHRGGAAMTLEYAYQDWCVAQMASKLGKQHEHRVFMQRASNWKNIFDESTRYTRPKDTSGRWLTPFEPVIPPNGGGFAAPGFIESNSAAYSYYVPQDIDGLVQAMGGREAFVQRLETSFSKAAAAGFAAEHGEHAKSEIDYDNQPGCHLAHLFSYAGAPWKTQYWVRRVKDVTFGDTTFAAGYRGDEDQGQMGALSALMAVGLFDVQGLADINPSLEITSPVFDKITFHLPGGKRFVIQAESPRGKDNTYIQAARLNGKVWNSFSFPFGAFAKGGLLQLTLGPAPNKTWGITSL